MLANVWCVYDPPYSFAIIWIEVACTCLLCLSVSWLTLSITTRNGMASRTVNLGIVTPMGETNVSGRTKFTRDQIVWNKGGSCVWWRCDDMILSLRRGEKTHMILSLRWAKQWIIKIYLFVSPSGETRIIYFNKPLSHPGERHNYIL